MENKKVAVRRQGRGERERPRGGEGAENRHSPTTASVGAITTEELGVVKRCEANSERELMEEATRGCNGSPSECFSLRKGADAVLL